MQAISIDDFLSRSYRQIVFAGGGNRCFWQAGLIEQLSQHACWQAQRLTGASAGAAIATAFVTGRLREARDAAVTRFNANARNVEWGELLKGRRPFMVSHIYPEWVKSFLGDADLPKLKAAPTKVEVVITRPLRYLPLALSTAVALVLYSSEKFWLKNFHTRLPHHLGFRAEYLDLAQSANLDEAHTWLLASAAAVPLTPVHRVHGRPALDGGFYDSVPLPTARTHDAHTLVLLTRHRPELPRLFEHQQRVYLQPAQAVVAVNMNCTDGGSVLATFEQGTREASELLG